MPPGDTPVKIALPTKCLNSECHETAQVRGLCRSCRSTVRRIVKKGMVTEEDLEARGKLLPKCPSRQLSSRTVWFLS